MKYLLFTLLLIGSISIFAQQRCDCDLTENYIKQLNEAEVKEYKETDYKKESRNFIRSKTRICQSFGYHLKAKDALTKNQLKKAKWLIDKERFILDSAKCVRKNKLENDVLYARYYSRIGEWQLSINRLSGVLGSIKKEEHKRLYVESSLLLAHVYDETNVSDRSLHYTKVAHPIVAVLPNSSLKVDYLLELASLYYAQFERSKDTIWMDSAQHVTQFGMSLARKIGYTRSFIKGYNLLEDKSYHDKNYRQALVYLDSALFYCGSGFPYERAGIFSDMADIYIELAQREKAYQYADSNYQIALQLGNPYQLKNALELLYNCAKLSGEYERALTIYEDLVIMRDSITKLQASKTYDALEERYHRVRKEKTQSEYEQDRRLLEQQREIGQLRSKLITVGLVIVVLLGCYIVVVFRQKNMRSKQTNLEISRRLSRARINPDFLYNALSSIEQSAAQGKNPAQLSKEVQSFSKLVKQLMERAYDDFLTLDKEVQFLRYYLDLQRQRSENNFEYSIQVDPNLDEQEVCLPTMILQPFIENTIERGFGKLVQDARIEIQFARMGDNELHICISDNGRSLKADESERAMELINDRLLLLNRIQKSTTNYIVRDKIGGGVVVELFMPLLHKDALATNFSD